MDQAKKNRPLEKIEKLSNNPLLDQGIIYLNFLIIFAYFWGLESFDFLSYNKIRKSETTKTEKKKRGKK